MIEMWCPIEGFSNYEVSSFGRVRSLDRFITRSNGISYFCKGRLILPQHNGRIKHQHVHLSISPGQKRKFYVHTLVLKAFIGPRPIKHECAHKDGNPRNNRIDNLRWATPRENQNDRIAHGTTLNGERHPRHKLSAVDVKAIRVRLLQQERQDDIAHDFGVSRTTISAISVGRSWRDV